MIPEQETPWELTPLDPTRYKEWLIENIDTFWAWASQGFQEHGRGALFIDAKKQEKFRPLIVYAPLEQVKTETKQPEILSRIEEYNPSHELVVVITREADQLHSALKLTLPDPPEQPIKQN